MAPLLSEGSTLSSVLLRYRSVNHIKLYVMKYLLWYTTSPLNEASMLMVLAGNLLSKWMFSKLDDPISDGN